MVFHKDLSQSLVWLFYVIEVLRLEVEFRVDAFNPLFTIKSKAHVPFSEERTNMVFQHVELGCYGHVWKRLANEL